MEPDDPFKTWFEALEKRHLKTLTFQEVRRALQALSSIYVERRHRLADGKALESAGKRAAYALFYGPLHFLQVRHIVLQLGLQKLRLDRIIDIGCGTGAAGAAWALEVPRPPYVRGLDIHPWAVEEARWTYRTLGLSGEARRGDATRVPLPGANAAVVVAFTANELRTEGRSLLLSRLIESARGGAAILVVEPIARRLTPWFGEWAEAFSAIGGQEDDWRLEAELPEILGMLDRAAGLDHSQLTCRTLSVVPQE